MRKNNNIEYWRLIFTILVCLLHFSATYFQGKSLFLGGYISVEFFFILSGFLLFYTYDIKPKKGEGNPGFKYTINKILKLYPHYIFSFLFLFMYIIIVNGESIKGILVQMLQSTWEVLMLQMSGGNYTLYNYPTWYISALLIVGYLIYYLLDNYKKIFINLIAPFSIIFIYGFYSSKIGTIDVWHQVINLGVKSGLLRAFAGMCLGCMCYVAYKKIKDIKVSNRVSNMLVIIEVLIFSVVVLLSIFIDHTQYDFILIIFLAIAITISFLENRFVDKILNNKFSIILGKLSYPIYLNHTLIRLIFERYLPNRGESMYVVFILTTIIYSLLTYMLVNFIVTKIKSKNGGMKLNAKDF